MCLCAQALEGNECTCTWHIAFMHKCVSHTTSNNILMPQFLGNCAAIMRRNNQHITRLTSSTASTANLVNHCLNAEVRSGSSSCEYGQEMVKRPHLMMHACMSMCMRSVYAYRHTYAGVAYVHMLGTCMPVYDA